MITSRLQIKRNNMKIVRDLEAHFGKERSELLILYANKRN